jgi:CheY-like chemotaxis protein
VWEDDLINTVDTFFPRPKVLSVDDDPAHLHAVTRWLRDAGFETLEAMTGRDAIDLAFKTRPDAIVLDIRLPDMNGVEVCQRFRQHPEFATTPIVHVAETYEAVEIGKPQAWGADSYLNKPVEPEALVASLLSLLRLRKTEEALRKAEQAAREADQFTRSVMNSLSGHIAVLSERGIVLAANQAWIERVDLVTSPIPRTPIGNDFFETCRALRDKGSRETQIAIDGIAAVAGGKRDEFEFEYLIVEPFEQWDLMKVTRFNTGKRGLVIACTDITRVKRAELAQLQSEAIGDQLTQRMRELATARSRQKLPVRSINESMPDVFKKWSREYEGLLDVMVEERIISKQADRLSMIESLVTNLAFAQAGPNDIADLHSSVISRKSQKLSGERTQLYIDEGRWLLLEVLGALLVEYREHPPRPWEGARE